MPIDIAQTIEVLKEALLRELGEEVDLIFRYGSHLKGNTHKYSDLDISFVPAHETTWHSITVLLDGVMIDFYPIHWSQLESMAEFRNISATVLFNTEIVYQRNEAVGDRFRALPARLRTLQAPEARPEMLRRAQELFQGTGYPYYLLRQAAAQGHLFTCLQQARAILTSVLHCVAVCNQAPIDTRKMEQVLALPRLPADFAGTVERIRASHEPGELLSACEKLLHTTRELLLSEQREFQRSEASFVEVFDRAYPELKGDLQHILLACERQDVSALDLVSLLHEMMIHMTIASQGVAYSGFNCAIEYEQDLAAFGFPPLLEFAFAGDNEGLHRQVLDFDRCLREFLSERSVDLCEFSTLEELQKHLGV